MKTTVTRIVTVAIATKLTIDNVNKLKVYLSNETKDRRDTK